LVVTFAGGKNQTLDNSQKSEELLYDSIEKVTLKLEIEASSKSGSILLKPKKRPKRVLKGKRGNKEVIDANAWFVAGLPQHELERLVLAGGHGDFLVCKKFGHIQLLVNDGGIVASFWPKTVDANGGLTFGKTKHRGVVELIDHCKREPFRANHTQDMIVLVYPAPGGAFGAPIAHYSSSILRTRPTMPRLFLCTRPPTPVGVGATSVAAHCREGGWRVAGGWGRRRRFDCQCCTVTVRRFISTCMKTHVLSPHGFGGGDVRTLHLRTCRYRCPSALYLLAPLLVCCLLQAWCRPQKS
jgi:hypothetical protein